MPATRASVRGSPLARTLLAAYLFLVAYASLHPFSSWRGHGGSPFTFLDASWPRYVTGFDLAANVAAYFPLGAFGVLALAPRLRGLAAATVSVLGAAAVGLGAAAGLALPSTEPEARLMGEARATLVERAQETVQEAAQKVQRIATEAGGAARDEARAEGLPDRAAFLATWADLYPGHPADQPVRVIRFTRTPPGATP
mgnify:CR=1 FL=1